MVERRSEEPCVGGPIPPSGTLISLARAQKRQSFVSTVEESFIFY